MAHEEQLSWEARWARPVAAAAIVSAIAQVISYALQAVALSNKPHGDRGTLIALHGHKGDLWGAAATQTIALLTLSAVLYYLFSATRHRRPEVPGLLMPLIVAGPAVFAIGQIVSQAHALDLANQFAHSATRHASVHAQEKYANHLLKKTQALGVGLVIAGQLSVAFTYVMVGLNSMRAGLLSRFMGILGVIIGALVILPLFPGGPSVVQVFWLGALAILFLGFWPGGRGPAWESGEADPWPSAAEVRARRLGEFQEPEPEPEPALEGEPSRAPHPVSKKKSRKRRR